MEINPTNEGVSIDAEGIHPLLRGGRRRKSSSTQTRSSQASRMQENSPVEIVCSFDGLDWQLGLRIKSGQSSNRIQISGSVAETRNDANLHWRIQDLHAPIKVTCDGTTHELLSKTPPILHFKLNEDQNQGVLTDKIRPGIYLLVYPDSNKIKDAREDVAVEADLELENYQAFLVVVEEDAKTLRAIFGDQATSVSSELEFTFDGTKLQDDSDSVDLYSELPHLCAKRVKDWQQVKLVVVGDDHSHHDSQRSKWRRSWVPQHGNKRQHLPQSLVERKGGKYYVRYYGVHKGKWEKLYSHGFRFQSGLRDIRIKRPETLGEPTRITFNHYQECLINIYESDTHIRVEPSNECLENGSNIITYALTPRPTRTTFRFDIRDKDRSAESYVSVHVHTQGLWWALAPEGTPPTDSAWSHGILPLCTQYMAPTSNHALWLRMSHPRLTKRVEISFAGHAAKSIPVTGKKTQLSIPLRGFTDAQSEGALQLQPFEDGKTCYPVAKIKTRLFCRGCNFVSSSPTTMHHHVWQEHARYRALTHEELVGTHSALRFPRKIYKCSHCGEHVRVDTYYLTNPTSTIYEHLETRHPAKEKRFRAVDNQSEVRRHFTYRCKVPDCTYVFDTPEAWQQHIIDKHARIFWEEICP